MSDIRIRKCCMCPAAYEDFFVKDDICSGCNFVNTFEDERGWVYFVRSGLGMDTFKTFYIKPGKNGSHGCRACEWSKSFAEAQEDLNRHAIKKGWKLLHGAEGV